MISLSGVVGFILREGEEPWHLREAPSRDDTPGWEEPVETSIQKENPGEDLGHPGEIIFCGWPRNGELVEMDWERSIWAFLLQLLLYKGPQSPHHPSIIRIASIRWSVVTTPMQALSRVSTITQLWLALLCHSKKVRFLVPGLFMNSFKLLFSCFLPELKNMSHHFVFKDLVSRGLSDFWLMK